MAVNQTSRARGAVLAGALILVALVSALVALKSRGFACGRSHTMSFRESSCEGEVGYEYWIGSVPGRFMLGSVRLDSAYPNDLPPGTPRETSERSEWFCRKASPAQGFVDEADPTTYPTTLGFAWMNRRVELSSHSRWDYCVLIVPRGLVLAIAAALTAILGIRLIRRGWSKSRRLCA